MPSSNGTASAGVSRMTNGPAKTVLVVEDNELNMKLFHDLLEAHGYNILQTKDGPHRDTPAEGGWRAPLLMDRFRRRFWSGAGIIGGAIRPNTARIGRSGAN